MLDNMKEKKIQHKKGVVARAIEPMCSGNILEHNIVGMIKEKPVNLIKELYSVSEDLYLRDVVETNHAINSGSSSVEELKIKYNKYIK